MRRIIMLFVLAATLVMTAMFNAGCGKSPVGPNELAGVTTSVDTLALRMADSLGLIKPGADRLAIGLRLKPYYVNEGWVDPNNPSSGKHVVMYFALVSNMSLPVQARLWKGSQYTWLNSWQLWRNQTGSNVMTYRLFADGTWWTIHKYAYFQSGWTLSQQFELCF